MQSAIRWLIGLAFIAKGVEMLTGVAGRGGGNFGVLSGALFAFAVLIVGAIILAPSLAALAATPFNRFIDSIYLPGGTRVDTPVPNYRLAEYYYRTLQHDLAITEYEKILCYHPHETRAYIALVDLWANRKGQPARAAKLYRKGLRKIRKRDARRELREAYKSADAADFVLADAVAPSEPLGGQVKFPQLR